MPTGTVEVVTLVPSERQRGDVSPSPVTGRVRVLHDRGRHHVSLPKAGLDPETPKPAADHAGLDAV